MRSGLIALTLSLPLSLTACAQVQGPKAAQDQAPGRSHLAVAACPPVSEAVLGHLELPITRAAIAQSRRLEIVAIGSSSTEGYGASAPARAYPARLRELLAQGLRGVDVRVHNKGFAGSDAAETMMRFERDVIALHPSLVIWQVGANAVLRGDDPATFRTRVVTGIRQLKSAGMDVIVMGNQRAPAIQARAGWQEIDKALQEGAREGGAGYFPRGQLMTAWAEAGMPNTALISADGLHHTDLGYDCVARELAGMILGALRGW